MKNICWFISSYFFTYSFEYSNKNSFNGLIFKGVLNGIISKETLKEKNEKIIITLLNGSIEYIKDEPYDFELSVSNYFIPFLLKNELYEILDRIPPYYFNFPFNPKNIFKETNLYDYFLKEYRPMIIYKTFNKKYPKRIFKKDSFMFINNEFHISTFVKLNGKIIKII